MTALFPQCGHRAFHGFGNSTPETTTSNKHNLILGLGVAMSREDEDELIALQIKELAGTLVQRTRARRTVSAAVENRGDFIKQVRHLKLVYVRRDPPEELGD